MKRFWTTATVVAIGDGWQVHLDGRPLRTQVGQPQVVPRRALAGMLAAEWNAHGAIVDARGFPLRDLADLAIDQVRADRAGTIARLMAYAESDTLCYRADPDEPMYRRQLALWEPLVTAAEAHHGIKLERASGVMHRAQPAATLTRLRAVLESHDDFTLAALLALAPLAASLIVALAALEPEAEPAALFAAANAEEDWQAEHWGWEHEAEANRATRLAAFVLAARFAAPDAA